MAPHNQRIDVIDALRGLALFGVLAVNLVSEFRVSIFEQFLEYRPALSSSDRFASAVVSLGMESKAICLFSLLFGFGLAMQFEHLSKTGQPHYWLARRLFVLLGFGLIRSDVDNVEWLLLAESGRKLPAAFDPRGEIRQRGCCALSRPSDRGH